MGFPSWEAFNRAMDNSNRVRFIPLRARGDMPAPDPSINHVQPSDYGCLNEESPGSLTQ